MVETSYEEEVLSFPSIKITVLTFSGQKSKRKLSQSLDKEKREDPGNEHVTICKRRMLWERVHIISNS